MRIHRGENVVRQVVDSLVMDVVFDLQETGGSRVRRINGGVPNVLRILDQCRTIV